MKQSIDSLTGLTRTADLAAEMERQITVGDEFAFVMADIDTLSVINRDFGHEAGDAVIRCVAKHLAAVFPPPCRVYRDQRDEFQILLPGLDKEEAFLKAEEARKLIHGENLELKAGDKKLSQSVSIGVSAFPDDGSRSADIIRRADGAILRAKKGGRNQVCLAREEKLVPKTSHYTTAQLEKLSDLAEKEKIGEATLLREALDDLLRKYDE